MAKRANSVIGIDLGKHVFKSVLLQRKGEHRFVLTNYASRAVPEEITSSDELAHQVKLLLKDFGGSAKCCALAVSDPTGILRIIEQPNTPVELLRSALRLNGLAVLNLTHRVVHARKRGPALAVTGVATEFREEFLAADDYRRAEELFPLEEWKDRARRGLTRVSAKPRPT